MASPEPTAPSGAKVFSLGYQGRDLEEVLRTTRTHGIRQVIDIRENAASRKPGFSSRELEASLDRIGVAYVHLPELGCSGASRHSYWKGGSPEEFREDYRRLLSGRPGWLSRLLVRIGSAPTLLLCLEREAEKCHRVVLEEELLKRGIRVTDL